MRKIRKSKTVVLTFWMTLGVFVTIALCSYKPPPVPEPDVVTVRAASGGLQSGFHGRRLAPFVVEVKSETGEPVKGVDISFKILSGPGYGTGKGRLSTVKATTDKHGKAQTVLTLPDESGAVVVEAGRTDMKDFPARFSVVSFHPPDETHRPLSVLSFNDFHTHFEPWGDKRNPDGGIARMAAVLKTVRANNDVAGVGTFILNAGDDYENTLIHNTPGALAVQFLTWDRMGVDVFQVGNHDYEFGIEDLLKNLQPAVELFEPGVKGHPAYVTFGNVDPGTYREPFSQYAPLFETNFSNADNSKLFNQTVIHEVGGINIGVFGVTTDNAIFTQVAGDPRFFKMLRARNPLAQGLKFLDPDPREGDYVNAAIDDLAALGADIIIAVSHTGLGIVDRANLPRGKDDYIARYGRGANSGRAVDLIISGHSHTKVNHAIPIENPAGDNTYIIQADEGGRFVARMDLEINPQDNSVRLVDSRLIHINQSITPDPEIKSMVDVIIEKKERLFDEPSRTVVAASNEFLSSRVETQSAMGDLIGDAFVWKLRKEGYAVDTSIAVPSLYRTDVWRGPITVGDCYQILSMHKMYDHSDVDDTLTILSFAPGLYNVSIFAVPETSRKKIGALEYAIEVFFSLSDVIDKLSPQAADELSIDFVALGNTEFVYDPTAKPFNRIVPETLKIGGEPYDHRKTYNFSMMHSMAAVLGKALDGLFMITDARTGKRVPSLLMKRENGEIFTDTQIPLWDALSDYLKGHFSDELQRPISLEDVLVTGDRFRTTSPDLTLNSPDIQFDKKTVSPGDALAINAKIRNLGLAAIESAVVEFYYEASPWDVTDDYDFLAKWEGFADDYFGSFVKIGETTIKDVGAYPSAVETNVTWNVPSLYSGEYTIAVRIKDVESNVIDPNTGKPYEEASVFNNFGPTQTRAISLTR